MPAVKGQAWPTFFAMATMETDECVEWPFNRNGAGYGMIWQNSKEGLLVHRLALDSRIPCPADGLVAAHGPCHNRACMNYRHLRWATYAENSADTVRDGTRLLGSRVTGAKLTEDDVREIRALRSAGTKLKVIAGQFGIAVSTASQIANRRCWAWL